VLSSRQHKRLLAAGVLEANIIIIGLFLGFPP